MQHNDILELQLPSKLLQLSNQEMCPERDFKVIHGGFSERPIHCLKFIPEHRLLISSGPPENSLQVWKIGAEDTDLIKMQQRISNEDHDNRWSRVDVSSSNATDVLHGSCSRNITVSDIGTGQASYRADGDCSKGNEE
uniref:WD repeat-containing protein 73-like n=1 Tax=Myxine glutinosa TaxID=7769 RepID=UPI00358E9C80